VYSYLTNIFDKRAAFLPLIDPESINNKVIEMCKENVDAILIGGSTLGVVNFDEATKLVKQVVRVPVIIFPGSSMQLSRYADAILFLSLLSGRNPEYLIGEHVKAAPIIKKLGIEVIPTGYLLIESGNLTSVLFMSHTLPIPHNKPDIAKHHALAAQYLGMKFVYLDAGSGGTESVSTQMIKAIKEYTDIPIFVGGGIRTPEEAISKIKAGASAIVVGNALEKEPLLIKDFATAIHKNF
jgi:phosphoglycerol geranylgeranyltransferase